MPERRSVFCRVYAWALACKIREGFKRPVPDWYSGDFEEDILWV